MQWHVIWLISQGLPFPRQITFVSSLLLVRTLLTFLCRSLTQASSQCLSLLVPCKPWHPIVPNDFLIYCASRDKRIRATGRCGPLFFSWSSKLKIALLKSCIWTQSSLRMGYQSVMYSDFPIPSPSSLSMPSKHIRPASLKKPWIHIGMNPSICKPFVLLLSSKSSLFKFS